MNNFEENNEFTRRPTVNSPEQKGQRGAVRRPAPTTSASPQGVRRPQSSPQRIPPQGTPQRRPIPPSASASDAPKRPPQRQGAPTAAPSSRPAAQPQRPVSENPYAARLRQSEAQNRSPRIAPDPKPISAEAENRLPKGKTVLKNLLIFLGMLAVMLFLSFALLLSSLHVAPEKVDTSYKYDLEGTELASVTVNKVLYMNLSRLSDLCAFTVSGSKVSLRYTAYNEEYVEFTIGSISAKINGDIVSMEGTALVRENDSVWIPLSFIEAYFNGLLIEKDAEKHIISVSRAIIGEDEEEKPIYSEITFSVKGSQTIGGIEEDPDIGTVIPLEFVNDLSEYEQYMNPAARDAYLILVNKTQSISSDYIPENLVSIADVRQDGRKEQMVECAEKALEAMFIELRSAGYTDVSVTSGYRSYNKQSSLFNTYLQREMAKGYSEAEAKEIVLTYSAFPGTSEHQTGLCCDMHNLSSADVAFANKEAYTWLKENCHKFGFIIRFPDDKVDITGYSFEPWHYRFVGRYHATRMYNLGMCLEEYTEYLQMANNN